jgi:choline dehydrogenase-like flavoprotein
MNLNTKAKENNTYDAIVVGSGISGGWAAKELSEKGLKTILLERGRNVEHIKDYPTAMLKPWEFKHRHKDTLTIKENYAIQSKCYAFDEGTQHFWVNDKENPYNEIKSFDWLRGNHVGGRSLLWGRQCHRLSELDFEANLKDGHGIDWPIRYKDIAPWYSYVEAFVGVSGQKEGLNHLPDGDFIEAMEMTCVEKHTADKVKNHFEDRIITIGRVAHATRNTNGRLCHYRNLCNRGCPHGGYFSSNSATLPAAFATGNLTLRPHSIVTEVIYDENTKRATGVRIIDEETLETQEFYAKIIFLNASTLGTSHILLSSTSNAFPNGLGNTSEQVGHNLMDHHFGVGASGSIDGFEDKYFYGNRPNGIYVPRFRNINERTQRTDYVRGFGYQGRSSRGRGVGGPMGVGAEFKHSKTIPGQWEMGLWSWGEHLPYYENKVTLNKEKTDKFGLATLDIDCEFKENELTMRKDMQNSAIEMLDAAGFRDIKGKDNMPAPGNCIHEMGTARMGHDPKTSVLNKWNQMHEVQNVFITDGSAMTSSSCVNPSLTYMALTARAVDYAASELRKYNL